MLLKVYKEFWNSILNNNKDIKQKLMDCGIHIEPQSLEAGGSEN